MNDYLLLTAGPVPISNNIKQILSQPFYYHRTDQFVRIYEEVTEGLQYLFRTKNDVLILTSSGTGGMEAAVTNFFSPEDQVLVVENGKFSERWSEIAAHYGVTVHRLSLEWGKSVTVEEITQKINEISLLKGVFFTHCETSTGALTDLETIVPIIRKKTNALIVVDAISSAGVLPLKMDDWGIDVLVSASQKGLGLPPGLAFVAVNNRAWVHSEQSDIPKYYLDLVRARQAWRLKRGAAFTPAIPLISAANLVLKNIKETGIESIWRTRKAIAEYFRAKIQELGLPVFPEIPADSLTVINCESLGNARDIASRLYNEFNIIVSRGQGQLAKKVIRVGHITNIGKKELDLFLKAMQIIIP